MIDETAFLVATIAIIIVGTLIVFACGAPWYITPVGLFLGGMFVIIIECGDSA